MNDTKVQEILKLLVEKGIKINHGLGNATLSAIESSINAPIPTGYKKLLAAGVPVGDYDGMSFPDWHQYEKVLKENKLNMMSSFEFDIKENKFWHESFGEKPDSLTAAASQALKLIETLPILLPVFGHRYIPTRTNDGSEPILSFIQPTDVIIYSQSIAEYFNEEFNCQKPNITKLPDIPFWQDLIE